MKKTITPIEKHMTEYPFLASRITPVSQAAALMEKHRIRHLPVIEKGEVVGLVSDRDLKQALLMSDSMQLMVADVMTAEPYCVNVGTALSEVAEQMAIHRYGSAIILRDGEVVGIFTTTDGMRLLSEITSAGRGITASDPKIEDLLERDLHRNTLRG